MLTACHKQLLFNDKVEYMIFRSGSLGIFLKTILFPLIKKFQGLLGPNFRHNIKHETHVIHLMIYKSLAKKVGRRRARMKKEALVGALIIYST